MNIFTKLLRIINRDFELVNQEGEERCQVQTFTDGVDTYQVDIFDQQPRVIYTPTGKQYYPYGDNSNEIQDS